MLASVVATLAIYQVLLMAVGYEKLRLSFLAPHAASAAHRAVGDAIVLITVFAAFLCVAVFGFGDDDEGGRVMVHVVAACALLAALALKIFVVRVGGPLARLLPLLGISVLILFAITWVTSAGDYLSD